MVTAESLSGKSALVTGASSGIGRATARALAEEGASVTLAARREDRLRELAESIESDFGVEALVQPTDVADEESVGGMVDAAVETFGGLDVVVNSAGVSYLASVEEMETDHYEAMTDVNVNGMFYTSRAVIPYLRESSGNLVFVGSFSGQHPNPAHPVYAATKWWVRGFGLSLAGQLGPDGVAVTVVNPSEVRTELGGSGDRRPTKDRYDPGEITEPEDVAEAVLFATLQEQPNAVAELDIYRRDKFSKGHTPDSME